MVQIIAATAVSVSIVWSHSGVVVDPVCDRHLLLPVVSAAISPKNAKYPSQLPVELFQIHLLYNIH